MANIKSQIKRNRQNEKAHARNKAVRSEIKTLTKNAETAAGTDEGPEAAAKAIRSIDKATQRGILHKNTAARRKSRLAKLNA
jgi:small subunit ribosomal protein S20